MKQCCFLINHYARKSARKKLFATFCQFFLEFSLADEQKYWGTELAHSRKQDREEKRWELQRMFSRFSLASLARQIDETEV